MTTLLEGAALFIPGYECYSRTREAILTALYGNTALYRDTALYMDTDLYRDTALHGDTASYRDTALLGDPYCNWLVVTRRYLQPSNPDQNLPTNRHMKAFLSRAIRVYKPSVR